MFTLEQGLILLAVAAVPLAVCEIVPRLVGLGLDAGGRVLAGLRRAAGVRKKTGVGQKQKFDAMIDSWR